MRRGGTGGGQPSSEWIEIARVTGIGTTTVQIPSGYSHLGFWIVGGGAGGGGDKYKSDRTGFGGNGGQAMDYIVAKTDSSLTVVVGGGGSGGGHGATGANGSPSSVTYDGATYTAQGGTSGDLSVIAKVTNSGHGGMGGWANFPLYLTEGDYQYYIFHGKAGEGDAFNETYDNRHHVSGGDGRLNVFNPEDPIKYGAGGGGGTDAYRRTYSIWGYGGDTGGGDGGHGANNTIENKGANGTSYGAGGGGGAFSSDHTYGQGGAGYQGIVIIYGKR